MTTQQPGNLIEHIHDESYGEKYNTQNLNHSTMLFVEGRAREQLNGLWNFVVDAYDCGLRKKWYLGIQKDEQGNIYPWDFTPDDGEEIPVPSCWNMLEPEWMYYEGSAWYSRRFTYQAKQPEERVFLRVGAANYDTKVFLNQEFLGNHYGGSTPFFVELTDHLQEQNLLQFCVNNDRSADRVPMQNTDWYNYGGVYRDVELFRVPKEFLQDVRFHLVPNDQFNEIAVSISVSDKTAQDTVRIRIPELNIEQTAALTNGMLEITIQAAPELWSTENPRLYDVEVTFRQDQVSDRVGFRQISVQGTEILLNGSPIFLRGISCHEDDEEAGKLTDCDDIAQRFTDARDLGCNFMRLAHYPHHELAAKIADEVGILLWEEVPVYWAIAFDNEVTYRDAENQLLELITRDYNRASVIIWSVGNENADTDERLAFMSNLAKAAKSLDPSRLTSAACLVDLVNLRIHDRLADALDVIGLNEYYGWYEPNYENLVAIGKNSAPDKPVIITETGAGALAGHHGTLTDMFTEEYMAEVYRRQIEVIRTLDYVKGMSPWILYDFRAPHRCNRFQLGWNRKGLIDQDKQTKKQAFYVLQEFYLEKADGQ